MAEAITFANLNMFGAEPRQVYEIGDGVIPEIAEAFGHDLVDQPTVKNLGELIGKVGTAKELQMNITTVNERLGTDQSAIDTARGWVTRTGLLEPVARSFMDATPISDGQDFELAIVTGGVRNWMARRVERLEQELERVETILFIGGNRQMKPTEGPDVEEDMTEGDYLKVLATDLETRHPEMSGSVVVETPNTNVGDEVMESAADYVIHYSATLVSSNAGAWLQNAGQLRRAIHRKRLETRGDRYDRNGSKLCVVSDGFLLGETGQEPTSTHQNPYSALGQIARNAQEALRHIQAG